MNFNGWRGLQQAWGTLSRREQWLLLGLAGLLSVALAYIAIWQPTRQRLEVAERQHRQQAELSALIQHAEPNRDTIAAARPLSVRINESATAAGLDMAQMDVDGDSLRLVVSGDAHALLRWLDQQEREGAGLRSLTLEVENGRLHAQVVFRQ
ncbi:MULTISPECIES: type II secretion system protein GspM [Pseudomonas]|uniref:type II secretion system protein GspM n=1 Tax=Pseudomonas TaxID=286 RepID=UPI002B1D1A57|nr:type II secretion system protein GspM [Pseudomonas canavaninivorans]